MLTITSLLFLFALLETKHFVADFPLQTTYMLGKFKEKGWVLPLFCHCAVHCVLEFPILFLYFGFWQSLIAAVADSTMHFAIDRIKAHPKLGGRWQTLTKSTYATATEQQKRESNYFWWGIGADQALHHLCTIMVIYFLL